MKKTSTKIILLSVLALVLVLIIALSVTGSLTGGSSVADTTSASDTTGEAVTHIDKIAADDFIVKKRKNNRIQREFYKV